MADYERLEQEALKLYYDKLNELEETKYLIPIDSNGKISTNPFDYNIFSIAQEEVINCGYMLAMGDDGKLSEDSIQRIEAMIPIVLDELNKKPEERYEQRATRTVRNDETISDYNIRLDRLSKKYELYTKCCEVKGVEPREIYTYTYAQTESRGR